MTTRYAFVPVRSDEMDLPVQVLMTPADMESIVRDAFMAGHARTISYEAYIRSKAAEGVCLDDLREG